MTNPPLAPLYRLDERELSGFLWGAFTKSFQSGTVALASFSVTNAQLPENSLVFVDHICVLGTPTAPDTLTSLQVFVRDAQGNNRANVSFDRFSSGAGLSDAAEHTVGGLILIAGQTSLAVTAGFSGAVGNNVVLSYTGTVVPRGNAQLFQ